MATPASTFAPDARSAERRGHTSAQPSAGTATRTQVIAGRILSGLAVTFMLVDSVAKVVELRPVVEGTAHLGYPIGSIAGIGLAELACMLLYIYPRTAVLGALLATGFLGGAVATHVRIESPLFTHILFPIYVAALLWGGLYLRDARVRALLPFRR